MPANRSIGLVLALLLTLKLTSSGVEDAYIRKSLQIAGLAANAEVLKELAAPPEGWPDESRVVQQAHSSLEQPDNGSILMALIALHHESSKSGNGIITLESAPRITIQPDTEQWSNIVLGSIGIESNPTFTSKLAAQRYADWLVFESPTIIPSLIDRFLLKPLLSESDRWLVNELIEVTPKRQLLEYLSKGVNDQVLPKVIERLARIDFSAAFDYFAQRDPSNPHNANLLDSLSEANPHKMAALFPTLPADQQSTTALPLARRLSTIGALDNWDWLASVNDSALRKECVDLLCMNAQLKGGMLELSGILGKLPVSPERNAWIGRFLEQNSAEMSTDEIEAWSQFLNK